MVLKSNAKCGIPVEEGSVFTVKINKLVVSIHKIIGLEGWFLNCNALGIMDKELKSKNLFSCVKESKKIMKEKLEELSESVRIFYIDEHIEISR